MTGGLGNSSVFRKVIPDRMVPAPPKPHSQAPELIPRGRIGEKNEAFYPPMPGLQLDDDEQRRHEVRAPESPLAPRPPAISPGSPSVLGQFQRDGAPGRPQQP